MPQPIAPIAVRPWTLNGLSERLLVSHYEHHYGSAVRTLNAVRSELANARCRSARLPARAPSSARSWRRWAPWRFTSCTSATWAGKGTRSRIRWRPPSRQHFGSVRAWRREFVRAGQSLAHGSGWVALTYSRRAKRFWNQVAADHSQAAIDAAPVLVLDMYEHAYQLDFGANATAYIDTFIRNINWAAVGARMAAGRAKRRFRRKTPPMEACHHCRSRSSPRSWPRGARSRFSTHGRATTSPGPWISWRRGVARSRPRREVDRRAEAGQAGGGLLLLRLRRGVQRDEDAASAGFDARFVRGGLAAWYALGGARAMRPPERDA